VRPKMSNDSPGARPKIFDISGDRWRSVF
jgi:hypothetical protein